MYITRHAFPFLKQSLDLFPGVLIIGARQVGKSTLLDQLDTLQETITLDNLNVLEALNEDAYHYIKKLKRPVAIDEIQRFPKIILVLKQIIDEEKNQDRSPGQSKGQFILTGSANILSHTKFQDSLAGRIDILTLEGLSASEVLGNTPPPIIKQLMHQENLTIKPIDDDFIYQSVFYGSYPDVRLKASEHFAERWFQTYEMSYIERDIRDLSRTIDMVEFGRFFHLISVQTGNLLNFHSLGTQVGLDQRTVKRYIEILSLTFQITIVQPYFTNLIKRVTKTPKLYMNDSGHACFSQGIHTIDDLKKSKNWGMLLETWLYGELRKLCLYEPRTKIYFHSTQDGHEVDFIIQKGTQILAVECKAKKTLTARDLQGLKSFLAAHDNAANTVGIILYLGDKIITFGPNLRAIPVSILFQ